MKFKHLLFISLAMTFGSVQAQITIPAPSSSGSVSSKIGLVDVTIDYSRPKMKGRKIFGEGSDYLVPFGKIWRTGANAGTIVTISGDVKVEGKNLPAGEYMLLTIPGADQWTVIFYKDKSIGGNMNAHKDADEQLRVTVKPGHLTEAVQTMTFNISDINVANNQGFIELAWENTSVKVKIDADYDAEVMKQIEANTKVNPNNYVRAATYYFNTDRDMGQALKWINMYLPGHENEFWNIHLKAEILAKLGKKEEAIATAKKSIEVAKANDGGDFGYIKRNEDLINSLK